MSRLMIVLAAALLVALVSSCSEEGNASDGGEGSVEATASKSKVTPVRTQLIDARNFSNYMSVTGTVKARNHIDLMVEEGGTVREIRIDKGRYAGKGDTLAVLENLILTAGYNQAQAALQQAELEFRSREVLFGKKAISENEFLGAKYSRDAAKAAFELAAARKDKLAIIAPMNGLVNSRYYDLGAYATPMTPIYEFIDNGSVTIRAGVAERFMGDLKKGTPVKIKFDAYPDLDIESNISFISRSINPQNRTFEVEVELPNRERKFAPEMVANLQILRSTVEDAIVVPIDAMIESESGWHVFVEENNQARRKRVEKVAIHENSVLVSGLSKSDKLIVSGQHRLHDGEEVEVVQ